jgi:sugar phosphate isomerase/epimerase
MSRIGFSTGALARGQLERGVEMARRLGLTVIELSALRLRELDDLLEFVSKHELSEFEYIALHAPADYRPIDEKRVAESLGVVAHERHWPVILHPDAVHRFEYWVSLGPWLYVENMDKRKPIGRTVEELGQALAKTPEAYVCFDIAHARQVDSSMTEAYRILRLYQARIRHMHFSEVSSDSKHRRISDSAFRAFSQVAHSLPIDVPVILESVVADSPTAFEDAKAEVERVSEFLQESSRLHAVAR